MTAFSELVVHEDRQARAISPTTLIARPLSVTEVQQRYRIMQEFKDAVLRADIDYGVVPGTGDKPTLLQPGAQKLGVFFGLHAVFEFVEREEDWTGERHGGEPFFRYLMICRLFTEDNRLAGESNADVNSWEPRYRWRWLDAADVPSDLDVTRLRTKASHAEEFQFAIDKGETDGKYGKPAQYWTSWRQAISDGKAMPVTITTKGGKQLPGFRMASERYRVPNEDIHGQINSLIKICQKRALVGAVLNATGASEFFTQDLDDFALIGPPEIHEPTVIIEDPPAPEPTPDPPAKPRSHMKTEDAKPPKPAKLSMTESRWNDDPDLLAANEKYYTGLGLTTFEALAALEDDEYARTGKFVTAFSDYTGDRPQAKLAYAAYIDKKLDDERTAAAETALADAVQPPLIDDDTEQTKLDQYSEGA